MTNATDTQPLARDEVTPIPKPTKATTKRTPKATTAKKAPATKKAATPKATRNTTPIDAGEPAKVFVGPKYAPGEIDKMSPVDRMKLVKAEKAIAKKWEAAGSVPPRPDTPILDWYEAQENGEVPATAKPARKSRATGDRPVRVTVDDATYRKAIQSLIADGYDRWTKISRKMRADGMGRNYKVSRPIILEELAAAGVVHEKKERKARTPKDATPRTATPIKKAPAKKAAAKTTATNTTAGRKKAAAKKVAAAKAPAPTTPVADDATDAA